MSLRVARTCPSFVASGPERWAKRTSASPITFQGRPHGPSVSSTDAAEAGAGRTPWRTGAKGSGGRAVAAPATRLAGRISSGSVAGSRRAVSHVMGKKPHRRVGRSVGGLEAPHEWLRTAVDGGMDRLVRK